MTDYKLAFRPAHELKAQLTRREISAVELLEACTANHERYNSRYNAIVTAKFDQALEEAKQLDATGDFSRPLAGLPLAVKDVFDTRGVRTTYGNTQFADHVPEHDSILVARERAAGALIIGKSNTPDCASGGITENDLFGRTLNPWNIEKTTSGSGGGGVAALASGMATLADGSDVGGSVRSPGARTNLVGFRPSSGRIPGLPGSLADGDTSTAGVFARCVKDAALFMEAVDGSDPRCAVSYPAGVPIIQGAVDQVADGVRIAWMASFADMSFDEEIGDQFADHKRIFSSDAARAETADFDPGEDYRKLYADFNAYAYVKGLPPVVLKDCLAGLAVKDTIRANVQRYSAMDAMDVHRMFAARDDLKARLQVFMQDHDVLAQLIHAGLAFDAGDYNAEKTWDWSALYLAPMLGLPSICVPLGFTRDGMPHGIQFTARAGEDQLLLQVARMFERETGYGLRLPPLE